jgi:hypothetical protein
MKIANRYLKNEAKLKCLGMTVTKQEKIKRQNLDNSCYHSVKNLLASHVLPKNIKIRIYKTVILPVVL